MYSKREKKRPYISKLSGTLRVYKRAYRDFGFEIIRSGVEWSGDEKRMTTNLANIFDLRAERVYRRALFDIFEKIHIIFIISFVFAIIVFVVFGIVRDGLHATTS